jgi:hypothetical protein
MTDNFDIFAGLNQTTSTNSKTPAQEEDFFNLLANNNQ